MPSSYSQVSQGKTTYTRNLYQPTLDEEFSCWKQKSLASKVIYTHIPFYSFKFEMVIAIPNDYDARVLID
jgi:hypothetical protein